MPDDDQSAAQRIWELMTRSSDDSDDSDEESDDEPERTGFTSIATSESSPLTIESSGGSGSPTFSISPRQADEIHAMYPSRVGSDSVAEPPDSATYQLQGPSEGHVIRRSPSGKFYSATKYGDLTEGRRLKDMEENTIEEWYFNEAQNRMPAHRVGEAFVGNLNDANGVDGIKQAVIDHATSQINDRLSFGEDEAQAFNNAAEEWPREAQALLCVEELSHDRHAGYLEDCRAFARAYDMTDVDLGQTELDLFYSDNPYNDDSLSAEEADIIMLLRVNDEDREGVLDRIDNYNSFIGWYEEIGEVEQALQAHEYDSVLSTDQMQQLAPPDEWPDEMDASSVERENCINCTRRHVEVYTDEGERSWMISGGDLVGGTSLDENYLTNQDFMCQTCFNEWQDNTAEVVIVGEQATVKMEGDRILQRVVDDAAWDDYETLTDREKSTANSVCRMSFPPEFSGITPDPTFGDSASQEEAIATLMAPETEFENGSAYIVNHDGPPMNADYGVYLNRENARLAQEVKQAIDSNIDHTATEQAA